MPKIEVQRTVPFYFVMNMKTMKYRKKDEEWVNSFHMAMRHQTQEAAEKVMAILARRGFKDLNIVKHTLSLTVLEDEPVQKKPAAAYRGYNFKKKTN